MQSMTIDEATAAMDEYARKRGHHWWWIAKPEFGVLDKWDTGAVGILAPYDVELRSSAWGVSAYEYAQGYIGTRWPIARP